MRSTRSARNGRSSRAGSAVNAGARAYFDEQAGEGTAWLLTWGHQRAVAETESSREFGPRLCMMFLQLAPARKARLAPATGHLSQCSLAESTHWVAKTGTSDHLHEGF